MKQPKITKLQLGLLVFSLAVLIWSGIRPKDRFTWFLEVAPVLIGYIVLIWARTRFRLTTLAYVLIAIHGAILCLGGRYTYAEVPLGFWVQEAMGFARNHYDRLGHLAQGFVPAILWRELFLRRNIVKKGWVFLIICGMCLAFSAIYEFIEWFTAIASGEASEAFLGTQGDIWDTQWDMFLALVGAILALLFFSKLHDKELKQLAANESTSP